MTADGATNKDKAIGECLTPSNMYPGIFNHKDLSKEAVLFLVGKFIFVFSTTGVAATKDEAKTFTKEANHCPALFKV